MDIFSLVLIVVGLCIFEIIVSIHNAIINAEVLSRMSLRTRKWFLFWGIIFAVFAVRGLLPWFIVWAVTPELTILEAFSATLSSDIVVINAVESSAQFIFMGGGVLLLFLFLHWLFLEEKYFGIFFEKYFRENGHWFFTLISIILTTIIWFSLKIDPMLAFSAIIGSSVFFIVHGFKQNTIKDGDLIKGANQKSDIEQLLYLILIGTIFSIEGVIGAFAFTIAVPLILIGNGVGAILVRDITIRNMVSINKYRYLKNGAMYSIFILGLIMIYKGFGYKIPFFITSIITISIIIYFFMKSKFEIDLEEKEKSLEKFKK